MQTEFYRSSLDPRPTFSLALVVSVVGIGGHYQMDESAVAISRKSVVLPACVQYAYYESAPLLSDSDRQAQAMQRFAEALRSDIEDNPQPVVDLLNRHFWDLV
jgi:hypothetical protein